MSTITESIQSPQSQKRTVLRWVAVAGVALGAVALASALPLAADNEPPATKVDTPRDGTAATELDIRGIPTWWSGWEPAP